MESAAGVTRSSARVRRGALLVAGLAWSVPALAAGDAGFADTFLALAILILLGKLAALVERFGQSAVVGEILIGVLVGNLWLVGFQGAEGIRSDPAVAVIAQLGVVILMFQVGLESDLGSLRSVGVQASKVAIIGVLVPFVLGTFVVGPWAFPGQSWNMYLFLGAALCATSVGITARVFRDAGSLDSREASIVLAAAVLDDVLGLIILAVISALVTEGSFSGWATLRIVAEAMVFLVGAVALGRLFAPYLVRGLAAINASEGMKIGLLLFIGLLLAWLAQQVDLAPIVGAFAAGLLIKPVYFSGFEEPKIVQDVRAAMTQSDAQTRERVARVLDHHAAYHHSHMLETLGHVFVPVFFVYTGMQVRLDALVDPTALLTALGLTAAAIAGKLVAGCAAAGARKWLVGWGMVPRGEVGLIFAAVGQSLGVIGEREFAVIVVMVLLTTLITPPILTSLVKRREASGRQ